MITFSVSDPVPEDSNSGETGGFNDQPWITLGQVSISDNGSI